MTYAEMTASVPQANSSVSQAARGFFSVQTNKSDRAKFLAFLLQQGRYGQLCELVYCGNLNGNTNIKQDVDARDASDSALHARYFDLFRRLAAESGISLEKAAPLYAAAVQAKKTDILRRWRPFAERALTEWASADYGAAWRYVAASDPEFLLADILVRVDRARALDDLTELAVSGKGVNKVALRRVLRKYPAEVFMRVRPTYAARKTDERVSAVRLLLVYKNDENVLAFLQELKTTEKARSVIKLLEAHVSRRTPLKDKPDRKHIVQYFCDAMVYGMSVTPERFTQELIRPPFTEVAESLFYGVYEQDKLQDIVIVDRGRILDIENRDIELPPSCSIKVLHPVELTPKTEFLSRLNITQPFTQIKRKVYRVSQEDIRRGGCYGVAGTVVPVETFVPRMRKYGFRALSRDGDNLCRQVGLARDGVLCVLNFSPVDLTGEGTVRALNVRFYAEEDVVRLGVQRYVEGVTPLSPAAVGERAFSEFLYSVYGLMGCR